MKRHSALTIVLLMTAALLSACGFHLRGSTVHDSMPFKSIFVVVPDSSTLGIELKRHLRAGNDTIIAGNQKDAQVVMEVTSEKRSKSILSINVQGRVREYTLNYQLRYRVRDAKNRELIKPTALVLKRTLIFSEAHALARESEEELLYRDMQTDMVQQIMRRLAAMKIPA